MKRALRVTAFGVLVALPVSADAPRDQYGFFTEETEEIADNFTKLTWNRKVGPPGIFATAQTQCASAGMRLPSLRELLTIVDEQPHLEYEGTGTVPKMIDPAAFPKTPAAPFWTSSLPDIGVAVTVNFRDGTTSTRDVTETSVYVRCVKDSP